MRVAIILNGISLQKKFFFAKILPPLQAHFAVEVFETHSRHDAVSLADKAVDKRFDIVFAAGGDGTVHQVLNGILHDREEGMNLPVMGIIPIGSGNDFARTLRLKADPEQIALLLKKNQPHRVDVGKISFTELDGGNRSQRYFINEVDIGMGPEVVKRVVASGRPFGSAAAYYLAILSTFLTYKPFQAKIKTPLWAWEGMIRTLAVANGKFYGHGYCIGPEAKPDDGLFSTFIAGNISVFDFMRLSGKLKKEARVSAANLEYSEAERAELTSAERVIVEADGEILGLLPASIALLPKRLQFLF